MRLVAGSSKYRAVPRYFRLHATRARAHARAHTRDTLPKHNAKYRGTARYLWYLVAGMQATGSRNAARQARPRRHAYGTPSASTVTV